MKIKKETATKFSIGAFLLIFLMYSLYSFSCGKTSFSEFISTGFIFICPSLVIPSVFLIFKRTLVAAVGTLFVLPWLMLAYYVDCIMPYQGGGASMLYLGILFWGPPSAIAGMIITGFLIRFKKIEIV